MSNEWPMNSKVRFTQERLSILTPRDRQGLAGRIGITQTDGKLVSKPTVYFPAIGDKPELRLFRVDPRQLELVELPPDPVKPQSASEVGNQKAEPAQETANVATAAPAHGGNLSQADLDSFFD